MLLSRCPEGLPASTSRESQEAKASQSSCLPFKPQRQRGVQHRATDWHRALQPRDGNPFSGPTQKQEPLESQLQRIPDNRRGTSWHNEARPCSFQYRGSLTVKSLDLNLSEAPYYCSCCVFNRICSCLAR